MVMNIVTVMVLGGDGGDCHDGGGDGDEYREIGRAHV